MFLYDVGTSDSMWHIFYKITSQLIILELFDFVNERVQSKLSPREKFRSHL